jgi:Cdc6-like AAA superfamily ATPase
LDNAFAEYQKAVASPNTSFDEKYAAQGKFNDVIDEMKEKGIVRDDDPLLNEYRSYGYQQDEIIRALYAASQGRVPLSRADNKSGTD